MIGFIIGCMTGGTIGLFTTCLCVAAKQSDRELGCDDQQTETERSESDE